MAKFAKGNAGKPKGAVNKLTKTVKETVLAVFNDLQSDPAVNLLEFGKKHPKEFYQIASKLIPTEIAANVEVIKRELPPFMKANDKSQL